VKFIASCRVINCHNFNFYVHRGMATELSQCIVFCGMVRSLAALCLGSVINSKARMIENLC